MSLFQQQFHLMESFFNQHNEPLMIVSKGKIEALNAAACRLLNSNPADLVGEDVKKYVVHSESLSLQKVLPKGGEPVSARIVMSQGENPDFQMLFISPYMATQSIMHHLEEVEDDAHSFRTMLTVVHGISLELSECKSVDEVYKCSIDLALGRLGFDRMGVLLYDKSTGETFGTWGTDSEGKLKDEHDFYQKLASNSAKEFISQTLSEKYFVAVKDNVLLYNYGKKVGVGWNAMVGLWDGDDVIGWLAADNLIKGGGLKSYVRDIFGIYGQVVASSIVRKRYEVELEAVNHHLEERVEEKTSALNEKMEQLHKAQNELIESEKLAGLGALVSGVAHEINTPVGISVTASSFLGDQLNDIQKQFDEGTLSQQSFQKYVEHARESVRIMLMNLTRASNLVSSFKQLAVDQHNDVLSIVNLHSVADNVVISYHHEYKNRPIKVNNNISNEILIHSYPGLISQIITNFFSNALIYAFDKVSGAGEIEMNAELRGADVLLTFSDTGNGVSDTTLAHLFDPFFTTRRGEGGSGLGLNIVYNIVTGKLKGKISAEHNQPSGLIYRISFPVEKAGYSKG
jgi:signal transduction histidine kinase